jgi:hypothetical protein
VRARLIRSGGIAGAVPLVGEQTPGVGRIGLQFQGLQQRGGRGVALAGLPARNAKLQLHRGGLRLFARQRLEHFERRLGLTGNAVRRAQHQARARMTGYDLQDLASLLRGQSRIAFEQTRGMRQRNVERSDRLR